MTIRMLTDRDFALLAKVPILSAFSTPELTRLLQRSRANMHRDSGPLFLEGEPATMFFVVLSGSVRLFRVAPDGRLTLVHVVTAGESFGEAVVLSGESYPVSAEFDEGTELLSVARDPFIAHLREDAALCLRVLSTLMGWERFFYSELNQLRQRSPAQRLAAYLLAQAEKSRKVDRQGARLPKHVIASRIGITPESFSRALKKLEKMGLLKSGQEVEITDLEGLRSFSGVG